jgi:hypothetical protein
MIIHDGLGRAGMAARFTTPRLGAVLLLALLVAAPGIRAEEPAALMARAPALPLEAPVTPLLAPVEVATAGWGPFRRMCVWRAMLRPGSDAPVPDEPYCVAIETAREEAGTWHLALRTEARGPAQAIAFATTRDARGRVGPVAVTIPQGVPPPQPSQLALLESVFRAVIEANGMERGTIAPDAPFILPLPLGGVTPNVRVEGGGFACRAEGETRLGDRRAIVAACTGRAGGQYAGGRELRIDTAGRFAIDVATGMVLRHGYASFMVMEAAGADPRHEIRGTSRQSLE